MSLDELHVGRARVTFRAPKHLSGEKARLGRALEAEARGSRLDVSGCGIGPEELVCIRALSTSPTRVRASVSARGLTERWVQGVEQAVREALARNDSGVVRYRSRRHALTDLVLRAARGDDSRAWAFAELGFWSAGSETRSTSLIERALVVLASQPPAVVPVLVAAAEQRALAALVSSGSSAVWHALAQVALRAAGLGGRELRAVDTRAPSGGAARGVEERVNVALERGALVRALATMSTRALSEQKHRALAVLCALSVESFSKGDEARLEAVVRRVRELAFDPSPSPVSRKDLAQKAGEEPRLEASPVHELARDSEGPELEGGVLARGTSPTRSESRQASAKRDEHEAVTRAGGLLFLVHLLSERGLYAALRADPALARFPLCALLHGLALRLCALSPDDPAALAFAGLGPGAEPPSTSDLSVEEDAALGRYVALVIDALVERLADVVELETEQLLAWVIDRRARIFADPGWIEARFSLDDVSTELRRAALDLHPNWLPALGVVLRFTYE